MIDTHHGCFSARERNTREIMMMYETSFATLSDRFFKNSSWPPVEYIEGLVDHDHVFCLLYKVFRIHKMYSSMARMQASQDSREAGPFIIRAF